MMVVCLLCVVLFLTGHQGKQHHHAGGLGESMRVEEAPEENDPYILGFFLVLFFCFFTLLSLSGSSVRRQSICI